MALKGFLMLVAADTKRDEKFVDSVMALLAQPGADITEVEHMANVEVSQLKFEGAVSGSKMGFMVLLLLVG